MPKPAFERILVTGGTGFIGGYVTRRLISDGYHPLITARRSSPGDEAGQGFDLIELDITDCAATRSVIASFAPQAVIHLAGATGHGEDGGERCDEVNFRATAALLHALEETGVSSVVMLGSAAEYGNQPIPFKESLPARPVSPYGLSKARATQYALEMFASHNFPVTVLRPFTVYGARQPANRFLSQLITHGLLDRSFNMSDGSQKRDLVHADDLADAIIRAMAIPEAHGSVINIGTGQAVALRDLAQAVWRVCDADPANLHIGTLPKSGDDSFDTEADISLAAELLDWRPTLPLLEKTDDLGSLRRLIAEMRALHL